MIGRLGGLRRLDLADQVADCDAVEIGDLRKDIDIRKALAALPLGDGLVGIIQFFGKAELGVLVRLAISGNVFGHSPAQRGFVDLQWWDLLQKR